MSRIPRAWGKTPRALVLLGFLLLALGWTAGEPILEQQEGARFDFAAPVAEGPSILLWCARRGAGDSIAAWEGVLEAAGPPPRLLRCIDLSSLPFFAPRWIIKRTLVAKYPGIEFLLDHGGKVGKGFGLPEGGTVALALGPGGKVLARVEGEASPAGAALLLRALGR